MSTIVIITGIVFVVSLVVTVLGYYALAAFIVHKTGATKGIADIGGAVAMIVEALLNSRGKKK
ncbi:Uncharacterised protein [Mycobacteroides abscessus subsp. abscessus]|uniref:hypothetical protein n=1 Tax=Mycobacteroides abscessus TaxID=36809 RepID=UPI0009280D2A|nr:hypothetical protein [Mycobacteroides abscessus]SHS17818.1 Uncharacterised protein [Mycobacteroides abscessus subsp. abscessus]